ncbi:MAG: LURP-one-related/scramblase family protein [Promethearchaeota archaeon]
MSLQETREFLMREKFASLHDKVQVMDKNQNPLGYFKGKVIKIGNTYRLYDLNDTPILTAHEKVVSLRSTYSFYEGGEKDDSKLLGKLKKKMVSIRPSYWFEDPDGNKTITMKGNVWALKYKLFLGKKQLAEVSKKLFKIRGTYGVKIDPSVDDRTAMLVLGIVISLHHEKEERR